jgi:hypothetical protein
MTQLDNTPAFDFLLPAAPSSGGGGGGSGGGGSSPPSGGGSSGGGGSGGGSSTTPVPPAPPGPSSPPSSGPGAAPGGVAGTTATKHRTVRAHGIVHAKGGVGSVVFQLDLSRGPGRKLVVQDVVHRTRFRAVRIASIRFGAHSARLSGVGLLNGRRVQFAALAIDNGKHGDVFRISWLHRAALGGVLVNGSVLVR